MALLHSSTLSMRSASTTTILPSPAKISALFLRIPSLMIRPPLVSFTVLCSKSNSNITNPQKYVYPDPIPDFACSETLKFRAGLLKKLSQEKETFGDHVIEVVDVCAEIFSDFLHKEYGGPGTLLVEPFTDMLVALKEKKLPGASLAARESLLWAQNYLDQDWQAWKSTPT